MKIKSLVLAVSLLSLNATASQHTDQVKFVAADLNPASNLCIIAAEKGIKAAKKAAVKLIGYNDYVEYTTTCNGMSLKNFAKQYKVAKAVVK